MQTAIFFFFAFGLLNSGDAFQCIRTRNDSCEPNSGTTEYPTLKPVLDLKPLLTLEGICFDACNDCKGPADISHVNDVVSGLVDNVIVGGHNDNDPGLVGSVLGGANGPLKCLGDSGSKLTGYQACAFTCILNLNVLDTCDVQVIIARLLAICPNLNYTAICASACLCCADDSSPLNLCVDVCLAHAQGSTNGVNIPLVGNPPLPNIIPQDIIPGLPGVYADVHGQTTTDSGYGGGHDRTTKGSGGSRTTTGRPGYPTQAPTTGYPSPSQRTTTGYPTQAPTTKAPSTAYPTQAPTTTKAPTTAYPTQAPTTVPSTAGYPGK